MQTATRSNAVRLETMGKRKPDDRRANQGRPLEVGQIVTLSFETEHGRGRYWKHEYMKLRVTATMGANYAGEVLDDIYPPLISPEKLRKGSVLTFTMQNVVEMADVWDDPRATLAELTA
ncbi:MAG: hypothetical protein C0467_31880 [Planctomycetaceae bacterium]|nr:hypothetical protein [Planctomycetaceae bacterium]